MSQQQIAVPMQMNAENDVLKGHYSNNVQVIRTNEEFVFDFWTMFPPVGVLASRVVLTPAHAKRLAIRLSEEVAQYEALIKQEITPAPDLPKPKIGFRAEGQVQAAQ